MHVFISSLARELIIMQLLILIYGSKCATQLKIFFFFLFVLSRVYLVIGHHVFQAALPARGKEHGSNILIYVDLCAL